MGKVSEGTWEDAILVVASVRAALINGTRHYAKDGRLLTTEAEVMQELLSQKEIRIDYSHHLPVTSEEEQVALASREFECRKSRYVQ
jgi:hypothetical protein